MDHQVAWRPPWDFWGGTGLLNSLTVPDSVIGLAGVERGSFIWHTADVGVPASPRTHKGCLVAVD